VVEPYKFRQISLPPSRHRKTTTATSQLLYPFVATYIADFRFYFIWSYYILAFIADFQNWIYKFSHQQFYSHIFDDTFENYVVFEWFCFWTILFFIKKILCFVNPLLNIIFYIIPIHSKKSFLWIFLRHIGNGYFVLTWNEKNVCYVSHSNQVWIISIFIFLMVLTLRLSAVLSVGFALIKKIASGKPSSYFLFRT